MKLLPIFLIFSILLVSFLTFTKSAHAAENPLSLPNNKIGIHILFDNELEDAAKLVNANGGDWGYVVIPLQAGDRDLEKWQNFMNKARALHVIPLVRLATEGDYFNTRVWRKPKYEDIMDFANFLNSLQWPTVNRYIIVFNEVNRADEWGGDVDPEEYAELLSYAVTVFKSKNQNFFIIGAGMDNAAANTSEAMNQYSYFRLMDQAIPGVFNQIDGFASHSYPNPAFSQSPAVLTQMSIASFSYESSLLNSLSNKSLPVFITETGWTADTISEEQRATYYKQALETVWNSEQIVAIAPFLLRAGAGPFNVFTFLKDDGSETKQYTLIKEMQKVKGKPRLPERVLGDTLVPATRYETKDFSDVGDQLKDPHPLSQTVQDGIKWIFKI
ncbi:MAG: hypothetical protein HY430_01930 [Candidatus Levybacteria bacterium]|nr:hypothetical protein [Candidatus Levybacteria bacterium]